ncbi:LamG-like jellyroll fold domain-containing protein [Actinocatenispora rupis]|uniref:Concanavalin A-like lectin/glucanases superfamily protein n=1 Tax=Actinocatenispora rupis TaxID=519421 RepID=A0A8J3NED1_9ACTN|nr:LamG-like jellyroll fold domain-containing protein [Actinocatenispora rupis]GID12464.1 hypothetical protein Aru02nite_33530 [Actinocatenispora rupis]
MAKPVTALLCGAGCVVAAMTIGAGARPVPAAAAQVRSASAPAMRTVASYGFNSGAVTAGGQVRDDTGSGHTLHVRVAAGGRISWVRGRTGRAARFPAPCRRSGTCGRAILEAATGRDLDAGTRPFRLAAAVRVASGDTAAGANVVQNGNWGDAALWKLQVDGKAGRPSCVVGRRGARKYLAGSSVSVADGSWHEVECRRSGASLRIVVDGAERGQVSVPAGLSLSGAGPLRVGGNAVSAGSDQFHGAIDDVAVGIG